MPSVHITSQNISQKECSYHKRERIKANLNVTCAEFLWAIGKGNKRRKNVRVKENHQSASDEGNCYIMKRFVIDVPHTGSAMAKSRNIC